MKHAKRKHSDFSPSAAKRWMTCPGSVRLSRLAPPQPESKYALEGTQAHECLEFIVKRYADRSRAKVEAEKTWPVEMIVHALTSADRIFSPDLKPSENAKLFVETRVVVPGAKKLFGTLDYAWVDLWGDLVIADYKYGAGVAVSPIEDGKPNPQLMLYALGMAEKYNFDFESVTLAVIQPRVFDGGEDPLTKAKVTIAELKAFKKEVFHAVSEATKPNAKLVAGEHCRWCPALATCPENSKKALKEAHIVFDIDQGVKAAPEVLTLDAKTLPNVLRAFPKLKKWMAAVEEHAHQLAESGQKIEGFKLVEKRGQRVWLPDAFEVLQKTGFKENQLFEKVFLSPAKFEKKFGKQGKQACKDLTVVVSSGTKLVPDSENEINFLEF